MKKNFGAKTCVYPQPVFIVASYDENGVPDAMNVAWGGISGGKRISMCISSGHKTVENILARKAFTVCVADTDHVVECDYVGIVSAHSEPKKMEKAGFHVTKSEFVDAPIIDELPMALECRLVSYNESSMMLTGEIVNVCAEESVLTNGTIDPQKVRPIAFDSINNTYLAVGEKVGDAFKDGKQLKRRKKPAAKPAEDGEEKK